MFTDVDADIYVLVDGDATYDAPSAPRHDRACCCASGSTWCWRCGSIARRRPTGPAIAPGNRLLTGFVAHVFGQSFTDMLSGYRVFTRRFVKSFPVLSGGFEIETELTVHALELELPVGEMRTPYYSRPEGSASKLSTWRDGFRILRTILRLYRSERPLAAVHGASASRSPSISIGLAIPLFITYLREGLGAAAADRDPGDRADAARRFCRARGLILDTVTRGRRELKLLAYLAQRAPAEDGGGQTLKWSGQDHRACANSSAPTMRC